MDFNAYSFTVTLHYTIDWFTSVLLPHTPRLSTVYFIDSFKVILFCVCIEPLSTIILYIIPESVFGDVQQSHNFIISLLHHCFDTFGKSEQKAHIHSGNNLVTHLRNENLLRYFSWRTLNRLNETMQLSYLSHGRTWLDLFFGLFKKHFRTSEVTTLNDIG